MIAQPPLWMTLIAFVCALGPLVFFHELGHYMVARWFGIGAETFSIGFGREIVGWSDKRGTRWKVGWLPLGGYVKFVGDMSAVSDPAALEDIPSEQRAIAFPLRPVWQRFLVVLAGPATNFLLAIAIFASFFAIFGAPLSSNIVGGVQPGSAAARAGIHAGDRILSVADRTTDTFGDIFSTVAIRPGERVDVAVERAGQVQTIAVRLGVDDTLRDTNGHAIRRGLLGITPSTNALQRVSPLRAIPMAADYVLRTTLSMIDGLVQIVRGAVSPKQLGGPIRIAQTAGEWASAGLLPFVQLVAMLSINLGFINLLPVPMLDGGHLLFYSLEAVRRRPVHAEAQEWAFRGGLAAILTLLLFVTFNDLWSIGLWDRLQRLIG